jgi:MoxR-like ATPase
MLHQVIEGSRKFKRLLTRFSTPEEVFGPVSLKELDTNDRYVRITAGKLPEADIAFLDEMWNANSSILNSLLSIMNEGRYDNDGESMICRPIVYAASNLIPHEPELAAIWDRVTFRHLTRGLREMSSRKQMFKARLARMMSTSEVAPILSWDDILLAQQEASKVDISDDTMELLLKLWNELQKQGVEPTDRRFNDSIPIIQATAYRAGRVSAEVDDFRLLRHVLWMDPKEIPIVDRTVLQLANPLDKEAMDVLEVIEKLGEDVDKVLASDDNKQTKRRKGVELNGKLDRAEKDLDVLEDKASKSARRSDMVLEARLRLKNIVNLLLRELFDMDDDEEIS